ncbi:MAG: transposase [Propionibacteriaceae bacterium]|nr:transposase [Propionibacteriaceae bacterium]
MKVAGGECVVSEYGWVELVCSLPEVGVESGVGCHDGFVDSGELGFGVVVLSEDDFGEERLVHLFKRFLAKIDAAVPDKLDIHLVMDNYGTHKTPTIQAWLDAHPRFHTHFTPTYSSWLNQVERFFGLIAQDLLQRSDHRSVQALEKDLRQWIAEWNKDPQPFIWVKTAEQILASLARPIQRINGAGH